MAAYDDLPIKRIVTVGLLSIAITIITVLGVQVLYFGMLSYVDEKKLAESTYRESLEALDVQSKKLSRFGVDEDTAKITIPIEQAMKQLVSEAAKTKTNDKQDSPKDEA